MLKVYNEKIAKPFRSCAYFNKLLVRLFQLFIFIKITKCRVICILNVLQLSSCELRTCTHYLGVKCFLNDNQCIVSFNTNLFATQLMFTYDLVKRLKIEVKGDNIKILPA